MARGARGREAQLMAIICLERVIVAVEDLERAADNWRGAGLSVAIRRTDFGDAADVAAGAVRIQLRAKAEKEQKSLLDDYGATDPAEFFAVATEVFFERPARLRRDHPELYGQLKDFYRQDPAQWSWAP